MALPFTHETFLAAFGSYNAALWPFALLLWIVTVALAVGWFLTGRVNVPLVLWLLATHWAWSAVAYHWWYFRAINPAATAFAAVFAAQAAAFAALAMRGGVHESLRTGWRAGAGASLVIYGLAYPVLGLALGLQYPRMPVFGVPCPTTLVTAGLLVGAIDVPRWSLVVPILWCAIGGSAALVLDMYADLALLAAGVILIIELLAPGAGTRAA